MGGMTLTTEWINTIIGCVVFVGSGIAAVARVTYVVTNAIENNKKEFNALLDLKAAEFDGKIGKVWERFDVYKNTCDSTFVRQQTCQLIHNGTEKAIAEMNRRMESMEKKLDALIVHLVEKKG